MFRTASLRGWLTFLAVGVVLAMALAACGGGGSSSSEENTGGAEEAASSSEPASESKESSGSGEVPSSGEVLLLTLTSQNPYIAEQEAGVKETAEELGWTVHVEEATESQSQQDSQVTQVLSSGKEPLGIIMTPFAGDSASASEQAITAAGIPLVIADSKPKEEAEELYTMYAGPNDLLSGQTAAQILVERAKKLGIKLGGGLVLREEPGYESGVAREAGFLEELEKLAPEATLLKSQTGNGFGPEDGYKVASQLVPQYKGQFNWMYGTNDAIALGGMQFVKSHGINPEEILAVGGTCLGEATNKAVISGLLAGSAVQSPAIEGGLAVRVLGQYLANGEEVLPGETTVSATEPPSFSTPPHKINNMPNPIIKAGSKKLFEATEIWGRTATELCTYG